jgi:hypothetical protein
MIIKATMFNEFDKEITLVGEYYPGCKGRRDSDGLQIEPDDDSDVDLISATDGDGNLLELTRAEERDAIDALWEAEG